MRTLLALAALASFQALAQSEIILDNGAPRAALVADNPSGSFTGTWPTSTAVSGYLGRNYQHHAAGTGSDIFTWTLAVPSAGTYKVYARWTQHANRATDATYTVNHAGGSTAVSVNQQAGGGAWNLLGTFAFAPGTAPKVTLTDQANGYVVADAIRLVPVSVQAEKNVPAERKLYFVHTDHLNTPRLVADAAGTTVWRWDQGEPFGNNPANENPSGLGAIDFPLRFRGTYADGETNLLQNVRRDLDPSGGRYIEADPIGLKGGSFSTYVHVANNPLSNTDPFGLTVWVCNRQVVWNLGGIGNHSYFWDDRNGQCCGRDQGHDALRNCKERGRSGGDACRPVSGSEGKEDEIMNCCQKKANEGWFMPPINDCHLSVDNCLQYVGLPNPGAPGGRVGACASCWLSDAPPPAIDNTAP